MNRPHVRMVEDSEGVGGGGLHGFTDVCKSINVLAFLLLLKRADGEKKQQLACPLSQAKNEIKCSLMGKRMNVNLCQAPQQSLLLLQHSCYSLKTHYSYVISPSPPLYLSPHKIQLLSLSSRMR